MLLQFVICSSNPVLQLKTLACSCNLLFAFAGLRWQAPAIITAAYSV